VTTALIDSQLLLLLVVGAVSPSCIAKHKRLGPAYTEADYDLLLELVGESAIIVTPNVLTETSNLLAHIGDPIRTELFVAFAQLMKQFQERYVESARAAERSEFVRLGLTDAAMLTATERDRLLLTADLDLYLAAVEKELNVTNFHHERERRGLV